MKTLFGLFAVTTGLILMSFTAVGDGYKVGDIATDFDLVATNGDNISLSNYADAEGYIVIFTCNSCPYSVLYEDRIIELHNKWADKGFPVIAINPNDPEMKPADSFEKMKIRASEKSFPFPYAFDDGQEVFPVYGATRTPHVYVLNKSKEVKYIGAIDDSARDAGAVQMNYIDNAVNAIKSGTSPDPSFTKAIGCSIKYRRA